MGTMTDTERYNGYANRETWAFNLHWQNDQGLYNETLQAAELFLADRDQINPERAVTDRELGEYIVTYWRDAMDEQRNELDPQGLLAMFEREVGSWWRIDYAEVGAAVRESLDAEGD